MFEVEWSGVECGVQEDFVVLTGSAAAAGTGSSYPSIHCPPAASCMTTMRLR